MFNKKKYSLQNYLKEKDLLPEEILADSIDPHSNNKLRISLKNRDFIFIYVLTIVVFLCIGIRVLHLQIVKGAYYLAKAEDNKINYIIKRAPRGIIYDTNREQLVQNIGGFNLMVIPNEMEEEWKDPIFDLIEVLDLGEDEILANLEDCDFSSSKAVLIKENIGAEKAKIFAVLKDNFKGFYLEENIIRDYKDANYFAHLLGYTGKINREELEENSDYLLNDYIGKRGMELSYEVYLKGKNGEEKHEVDSLGDLKRAVLTQEPEAGSNIVLNIDAGLQRQIQDALEKNMISSGASKAAAIAIDPRDGSVRGLVSLPSFNNNLFAEGISWQDYERLISDKNRPLLNRAISGEYSPGSTFKPLVAVGVLGENIMSSNEYINCHGALPIINRYTGEVTYKQDWKTHGSVNMYDAIAHSCNVYFYIVGGGYEDIKGLGIGKIKEYAEKFGFGRVLGIDLSGESAGFIPDKKWKEEVKGESWYTGDTYNVSIGQGDILSTPLQIAMYTGAIANGGDLWKPRIVDKIEDSHKNVITNIDPIILAENIADKDDINKVKQGMGEAVKRGSAVSLLSLPVTAGAKTGTAQYGSGENSHAWFTCFAPFDNPELVVTVLIEEGGEGYQTALPVAKEALQYYFRQKE